MRRDERDGRTERGEEGGMGWREGGLGEGEERGRDRESEVQPRVTSLECSGNEACLSHARRDGKNAGTA